MGSHLYLGHLDVGGMLGKSKVLLGLSAYRDVRYSFDTLLTLHPDEGCGLCA